MTEITHEALNEIADALRRGCDGSIPIEAAEKLECIADALRTGQLIHAVPSDYLTRAHAQIASGQSKENTELDSALIAQPSGDEVEAVAQALCMHAIAQCVTLENEPKDLLPTWHDWKADAMAAIAALDAIRGKQ